MKRPVVLLSILIVSSLVIFWNISTGSLLSWDECLYGVVAKEIHASGEWIRLTWLGQPWNDKPPLYMWVTALFFNFFGVGELSVRLFSAICAVATVIVVFLFAERLYSRIAAVASAFFLLSTWHFIWSAKIGMLDSAFTFFLALSLYFFMLGEDRKSYLFLSMLAFAAAFLTRGVSALLIPFIILVYVAITRNKRFLKEPMFIGGLILALVILVLWHGAVFSHYGRGFLRDYFLRHLFSRSTQVLEGHAGTGTVFSYLEAIPNKGRPWGAFGIFALAFLTLRGLIKREKTHLLPVVWALSVLVLFSLAKTKNHWYIIPIYPALSLGLGWLVSRLTGRFTVPVVVVLAVLSLSYLAVEKRIFYLDYSPQAKKMAAQVQEALPEGQRAFLYEVGDPAVVFYLHEFSVSVPEGAIKPLLQDKDKVIVFERKKLASLPIEPASFEVISQTSDYLAIRTAR